MFGPLKRSPRLGQWNGPKRLAPHAFQAFYRLTRGPTLARLGVVLLTVAATTALAAWWGPPLSFRPGEVRGRDLRTRVFFEVVNDAQTQRLRDEAVEKLPPPLRDDPVACERARQDVAPVFDRYPPGTPLVQAGQPITEAQVALLEEENRAFQRGQGRREGLRRGAGLFLVLSLLAGVVVLYVYRFQQALADSLARVVGVCALMWVTLALGLLLSRPPWEAVLLPLTVAAVIVTLAFTPQFALLMSFSLALATTVSLGTGVDHLLVQAAGLATAVLLLRGVRTRTRLVEVGLASGLAFLAMTVATEMRSGQTWQFIASDAFRNLAWGALAGFLVTGCLPLIERGFGIVTDVSLMELSDGSHPLMQELIRRAPGTYNHSMTVATLAEPAAEAIGANPLLTRVGCYFHDVGKMVKPHYFIENQAGENRHDSLEPALSTLIIIGHVKDGLALAEQYRLPRPIIDFIAQHHGTTLVEYFYREALRLQESQSQEHGRPECPPHQLEPSFRYPGPKPQSPEAGIAMLADAVESSSRALTDPTPSSLRKLVHDLVMKRLLDGQFEESGLTLTELHRIEECLCKGLIALYHARIKYPDAKDRGMAS